MENLWLLMENLANPMTAIFAHYRIVISFGVVLDYVTNIAESAARLDELNRFIHAFLGHLDQAFSMGSRSAHKVHGTGVTVVTLVNHGYIDVDDVPRLKHFFLRGDAVTDDVVDRGANGFGETAIAQAGRDGFLHIHDMVVADFIQFGGGYAGLNVLTNHLQHFCRHTASNAHFFDFFGGFDSN